MFFKKLTISLALTGIVVPSIVQGANFTNHTTKFNGHLEPFNPKAFDHSMQLRDGSYYAYYYEYPFVLTHGRHGWGYILRMSKNGMYNLLQAYDWAKTHGINPQGGMITYLTSFNQYQTPYTGKWGLAEDFFADSYLDEDNVISNSFATTTQDVYGFINTAHNNDQTVDFFFYTEEDDTYMYGKVMMANVETDQVLNTSWYQYKFPNPN